MNRAESNPDQPAPYKRSGVTDYVASLLHEEIGSGRWPLGSKIPVESDLVAWTGAGRNSVREAVQSLVQAGLLRRDQGRGTFVIANSQLTESLRRRLSTSDRRQSLELRFAIDSATAALAAERRTDADVEELKALLEARSNSWSKPDLDARIAADTALHRAIVSATHNELFVELYDGLLPLFEDVLRADVEGDVDPHGEQHAQLIAGIVDRDPARASAQIGHLLKPLLSTP